MLKTLKFVVLLIFIIVSRPGVCVETSIYQNKNFLSETTGEYISEEIKTNFKFDEAIISWNCKTSPGAALAIYLRAGKYGAWTSWYLMGDWGAAILKDKNEKIKKDAYGRVNEDTLILKSKFDALQYKIVFFSKDGTKPPFGKTPSGKTPSVRLVTICYTNTKSNGRGGVTPPLQLNKQLPVPYRSQRVENKSISGKICGPTSLSMLLEYYKINLSTADVAQLCYDKFNDIYGNWPYLVAFASEKGLTGWAQYFTSLNDLKKEIKNNHPVIVGISFGNGELTGSPVPSTPGHLLVVRGFDKGGNVCVNDPAFLDEKSGVRVYDKNEFAKAWLKDGLGVALIFRK